MERKNILITGISKGLGLEITKKLLDKNYSVYGISRNSTDELEILINKYKNQLFWKSFELSDIKGIKDEIIKDWIGFDTPINGFVNNAAMAYDDIATNVNIEKLEKMFSLNVFSPIVLTKYVIRQMLLHNIKGSIVHISSISAHTGYKGLSMYAASKGSLEAYSKNVAREWGEKSIRSNCVVAGFMETEMSASLTREQKDRIYKRTSLKISTRLESVAATVEFLLSDEAVSITGQNLFVDSGTI